MSAARTEKEMSLILQPPLGSKEIDDGARRVLPFAIHTQAWSSPRVEGLRFDSLVLKTIRGVSIVP